MNAKPKLAKFSVRARQPAARRRWPMNLLRQAALAAGPRFAALLLMAVALAAGYAHADGHKSAPKAANQPSAVPLLTVEQRIKTTLEQKLPGSVIIDIVKVPEFGRGMYHAVTEDFVSIYTNADASNFIIGDHYTFDPQGKVKNLSKETRELQQFALVKDIPPEQLVIFPAMDAKGNDVKSDKWVLVFTDVDCGYCRKFHREIEQVNRLGIEVRYAAFPRRGVKSPAYDTAVSIWCAEDPQASMTAAKAGLPVAPQKCANPVEEQYKLGIRAGVKGTPTMWTSNGARIPGYVAPQRLLSAIQG